MRLLLIFVQCLLVMVPMTLYGQTLTKPLVVREIAVVSLIDQSPPELFFQKDARDFELFRIGQLRERTVNRVPMFTSDLVLYRSSKNQEGKKIYTPAFQSPLTSGTGPVLMVFHYNNEKKVTYKFIEEQDGHIPHSVRLINLSDQAVGIKLDNYTAPLPGGVSHIIKIENPEKYIFAYARQEPDGHIYQSPARHRRFPTDDMRCYIFFAPVFKSYMDDAVLKTIQVIEPINVYDRVLPAPRR